MVPLTLALVRSHRVTDGAFHFWDATDDFSKTNMDLLFEGDRLYLHKATGYFGAVPMAITGAPTHDWSCHIICEAIFDLFRYPLPGQSAENPGNKTRLRQCFHAAAAAAADPNLIFKTEAPP